MGKGNLCESWVVCTPKTLTMPSHLPPIAAPSRPDQPASHILPVPQAEDPLACVKIPCFGD